MTGWRTLVAPNCDGKPSAMAAAHSHIEHKLVDLRANERLVRQEEITEEIIELVAGQTAQRH